MVATVECRCDDCIYNIAGECDADELTIAYQMGGMGFIPVCENYEEEDE